MTRLFTWVIFLVAILSGSGWTAGEDLGDNRRKLEEIRRRIQETTRTLDGKKAVEKSLAGDLKIVEAELVRMKKRGADLDRQLESLNRQVVEKEAEGEKVRRRVAEVETQVRKRLVILYKGGETGRLRVLFDGSAPARVAEEYDYLGRIVRRDRGLLALYRQQLEDLGAVMAHLGDLRSKQLNLLAALQRQRDDLHQAGKLKEQLLARARRDRTALALSLDTLRDSAESLSALIKKLETAKPRGYTQKSDSQSPFGREKGRLPWPLTGEILSGFGTRKHPEIGALYDSQGIEIAATGESAAITAVWDGQVVFANWFKGYGNLLILDHGDSYHTLYAQASRLTRKIGDRVARGEPVGFSGSEGAVGVYFEIRHGGTPLNPAAWLIPRKKS